MRLWIVRQGVVDSLVLVPAEDKSPNLPLDTLEARDSLAAPGARGSIAAKARVVGGPDEGREIVINGPVVVGTQEDADLILTDPHVSRRHAVFTVFEGHVVVHDQGSRNGTIVNGVRVTLAQAPPGSVVHFGPTTAVAVLPAWYTREVVPSRREQFGSLLGQSVAMRELFAILERVSTTEVPVLIEGETGTGKELAARAIHDASPRARGRYVVFDCGAVPRDVAESELFGHRRGAFTGAVGDRDGAFVRANGGTILLDEIGELPLDLQPKLLRVLETGECRGVGDDDIRKVNVRVLAATNRDLHAEARRGTFRADLLYRLDVVKVRMPALRHRPEDIAPIAQRLLDGQVDPIVPVAGENLTRLLGYAWPGNVRELRNVLTRAVVMGRRADGQKPKFSELVFNMLGPMMSPLPIGMTFPGVNSPVPYKQAKQQLLAAFDRAYIDSLLARNGDNVSRAAVAADLSRKHLHDLIRRVEGHDEGDPDEEAS